MKTKQIPNNNLDTFCKEQRGDIVSEFVLYRPYGNFVWIALFMSLLCVMFFILDLIVHMSGFLLFASLCLLLALYAYNDYSKIIAFGQTEIQVFGRSIRKKYLWTDFHNAYYERSYKGFLYLVLSAEPLEEKQVRSLCNRCYLSSTISSDGVLVFSLNNRFETKIKDLVEERMKK